MKSKSKKRNLNKIDLSSLFPSVKSSFYASIRVVIKIQNMGMILLWKVVLLVRTLLATRETKFKSNQLGKKRKEGGNLFGLCNRGPIFRCQETLV